MFFNSPFIFQRKEGYIETMETRRTRRYRRAYGGKKNLTLQRLLERQPAALAGYSGYELMISHYRSSEKLRNLKMNRQCYRLLDKAIIRPEHLPNLYRTYRLPDDPFFPLFLSIKTDYLRQRLRIKEERDIYILNQMKLLPREKRKMIRFLAELEESISAGSVRHCWDKNIYPGSKKRAGAMRKMTEKEWTRLVDSHFRDLTGTYHRKAEDLNRIRACLFLGILPELSPFYLPDADRINRAYRKKSRTCHPDSGGEEDLFIRLQQERDLLLSLAAKDSLKS
ncbi:MAG: hypothetical protein PQJ58_00860 [Spirochaetales bacterium]|nr:hypothetical protein [Spirochaetales bacterium]